MSNRFKADIEEEITLKEVEEAPKAQAEMPRNFFTLLFSKGVVSQQKATEIMPFIIFLAGLSMVYIGNRHGAENSIRKIDKLNKEVKELSWDFKTLKADLMFKSKQTEVAKKVDTLLGLKEPVAPPIKIMVKHDEY